MRRSRWEKCVSEKMRSLLQRSQAIRMYQDGNALNGSWLRQWRLSVITLRRRHSRHSR